MNMHNEMHLNIIVGMFITENQHVQQVFCVCVTNFSEMNNVVSSSDISQRKQL